MTINAVHYSMYVVRGTRSKEGHRCIHTCSDVYLMPQTLRIRKMWCTPANGIVPLHPHYPSKENVIAPHMNNGSVHVEGARMTLDRCTTFPAVDQWKIGMMEPAAVVSSCTAVETLHSRQLARQILTELFFCLFCFLP